MWSIYLQGLVLGAAMILPLGPQNIFVMTQGMRRQYHLLVAGLCAVSDTILIGAGVFGGHVVLSQSTLLLMLVTWAGVAFLLWYGWGAFKCVLHRDPIQHQLMAQQGCWRTVITVLAVTWLNPHVYLDTFVVLGSFGGQLEEQARVWFASGAVTASFIWFFSLALLAAWFSPWLRKPLVQSMINLLVALMMWGIAIQLARSLLGGFE